MRMVYEDHCHELWCIPHLNVVATPVPIRCHLAANERPLLVDINLITLVQQLYCC